MSGDPHWVAAYSQPCVVRLWLPRTPSARCVRNLGRTEFWEERPFCTWPLALKFYAERFVRSIKDEWFDRMILFGERSLRKATREFAAPYHTERNHQGLETN